MRGFCLDARKAFIKKVKLIFCMIAKWEFYLFRSMRTSYLYKRYTNYIQMASNLFAFSYRNIDLLIKCSTSVIFVIHHVKWNILSLLIWWNSFKCIFKYKRYTPDWHETMQTSYYICYLKKNLKLYEGKWYNGRCFHTNIFFNASCMWL